VKQVIAGATTAFRCSAESLEQVVTDAQRVGDRGQRGLTAPMLGKKLVSAT
jgi:hypothetical protein